MTMLFMDGFDHYGEIRRKWVVSSSFDNPTFVSGRFGGQALKAQFQNHASSIKQSLGAQTDLYVGFALFLPGFGGGGASHLRFYAAAGGIAIAQVRVTSVGEIQLTVSGQTVVSTSSGITADQWHYLEVHYTAKSSGGIFECKVNEVVVATMTGDTIGAGIPDDIESVGLVCDGTNTPRYLYDDLYILNAAGATNNTYLGDSRISAMYADSNGTSNDFTSNTGDNFEAVDEISLDDSTYVESGLLLAKEDYNNDSFVDRGLTPGTIHAVQTCNATLRTDAGTIRFKNEMVVAGVRYTDDIEHDSVTGNYFIEVYPRDTDPSDDAAWTEAKVDAVGSGLTLTFRDS